MLILVMLWEHEHQRWRHDTYKRIWIRVLLQSAMLCKHECHFICGISQSNFCTTESVIIAECSLCYALSVGFLCLNHKICLTKYNPKKEWVIILAAKVVCCSLLMRLDVQNLTLTKNKSNCVRIIKCKKFWFPYYFFITCTRCLY